MNIVVFTNDVKRWKSAKHRALTVLCGTEGYKSFISQNRKDVIGTSKGDKIFWITTRNFDSRMRGLALSGYIICDDVKPVPPIRLAMMKLATMWTKDVIDL